MKQEISPAAAVGILAVVALVVGLIAWRVLFPPQAPELTKQQVQNIADRQRQMLEQSMGRMMQGRNGPGQAGMSQGAPQSPQGMPGSR